MGTAQRDRVRGREATCKNNGSKPEDTYKHNKYLGAKVTLSVRHRAEARQGGGRSGAPKINSKRHDVKIYGFSLEQITPGT